MQSAGNIVKTSFSTKVVASGFFVKVAAVAFIVSCNEVLFFSMLEEGDEDNDDGNKS